MRKLFFKILQLISLNFFFLRIRKHRLYVLMFHQVNDENKSFYRATPVKAFEEICRFLTKYHNVIHISEVENHFKSSKESAVIITFDDGHYDIIQNALPVLIKYNLKFNININTETLEIGLPQKFVQVYDILNQTEKKSYINERFMKKQIQIKKENPSITEKKFTEILSSLDSEKSEELIKDMQNKLLNKKISFSKMLSKDDIKKLREFNIEIGSHSHTHSVLTNLSIDSVKYELIKSKEILESITSDKIEIIAYPIGLYNPEIETLAKTLGYKYFLKTDDEINYINNPKQKSFFRINQYFQTAQESLASMYGFHRFINNIRNRK